MVLFEMPIPLICCLLLTIYLLSETQAKSLCLARFKCGNETKR